MPEPGGRARVADLAPGAQSRGGGIQLGDRVVRNPDTWQGSEFGRWGRDQDGGVVVETFSLLRPGIVAVRWPDGRCFERIIELLATP